MKQVISARTSIALTIMPDKGRTMWNDVWRVIGPLLDIGSQIARMR